MFVRLNEQRFANRNKIWYRGRDVVDNGFEHWGCLYLTSKVVYAYNYAISNGFVEERVLTNTPLNIFNANSTKDFHLARKYFGEYYANQMKSEDWYSLLGEGTRQNFLDKLKMLKCDGFFNFEDMENDAPSLGLFRLEDSKVVGKLTLDQIRNSKEFELAYVTEKRRLADCIRVHIYTENFDIRLKRNKLKFLKEEDILKTFNNFKNSKRYKNASSLTLSIM